MIVAKNELIKRVETIITFFRYLIGGVALYYMMRSGLAMVLGAEEPEVLQKQKKVFSWGFVGLVVVMAASTIVNRVVFPVIESTAEVKPEVETGVSVLVQIINILLAFTGGIANSLKRAFFICLQGAPES